MACASDIQTRFLACQLCDNETAEASHHCDKCLANVCADCSRSHEKEKSHRVETGVCNYNMELELCPTDGEKMSFFCQFCNVKVCPQCEILSKKHVFHTVVTLDQHIGSEKEKLLDRLDDVTTKTESVSYLQEDIKAIVTKIELQWLQRKEMMRQEFASLLETIIFRQQQLMEDMEKEVNKCLQHLKKLQQSHDAVVSATCQLSDDCIAAVQNLSREEFLKDYPLFLESADCVVNRVERMPSPEDLVPAFLGVPFSLHCEKLRLHLALQLPAFDCQQPQAIERQRFIPFWQVPHEVTVNMLVDCTTPIPPSSSIRYAVNIVGGLGQSRTPVWSTLEPVSAEEVVLNGVHGFPLSPGGLYVIKISPVIIVTSHKGDQTVKGRAVSIVIVTESYLKVDSQEKPMMQRNQNTQVAKSHPGSASFSASSSNDNRGIRASAFSNSTLAGNHNNNSTSGILPLFKNVNVERQNQHITSLLALTKSLDKTVVGHIMQSVVRSVFHVPGISISMFHATSLQGRWLYSMYDDREEEVTDLKSLHQQRDGRILGKMQWQERYKHICSFEEARLLEDPCLHTC